MPFRSLDRRYENISFLVVLMLAVLVFGKQEQRFEKAYGIDRATVYKAVIDLRMGRRTESAAVI